MSFILGCKTNSIPIANLYENSKVKNIISYIDNDDLPDGERLTQIRLNNENEMFFPYINDFHTEKQTQRYYICGESGVGKTTFLVRLIFEFHKKYPKSKILFFSSKTQDENIDKMKFVERVEIDDDILTNQYTLPEITENSKPVLTIFDDIEDFPNKKITKEIDRLLNEILRNGRSYGIYCAYTHHQPSDYKATRNLIFEATHCVIFPKRSGKDAYNYFMEKKLNLNKKIIDKINGLKSNYVCIKKNIPKCVISDKYMLLA